MRDKMCIIQFFKSKKDPGPLDRYFKSIIMAGLVSTVGSILIRSFPELHIKSEEYFTETIAKTTIQTFIGLTALVGIFVIFGLQMHFYRKYRLKPDPKAFFSGYDIAFSESNQTNIFISHITLRHFAQDVMAYEDSQKYIQKTQKFRTESLHLISLLLTISILSYLFLFFSFIDIKLMKDLDLELGFCIFITVLCIEVFFSVFQFISSSIHE
jgi:hypothetical protein